MPRPAVIVGLGGTGQWVLTWLKRDLLLSNNGAMPDNVKLLEIDTATRLEAGATQLVEKRLDSGEREEAAIVGGVTLSPGEFVYVGGEARGLAEQVRNKKYPQIGQWFRAERWLNDLPTTAFNLDDGAGRLRQFGRLAIFKDILGQETDSRIWRALRTAVESVRVATNEDRKLEIILVGSFAGGTGSGLFIDTALILRILSQQLDIHHILRGFFALPSVFTTSPDSEMRARSFAAWRELNRFMVVNPDFPMPLIQYVLDNRTFQIRPQQRLFDACYLVDGKRENQPIAAEAKFGAFPVMAEAISAILDDKAGTAYTQWIFTNLAPEYSKRPDIPMYSAIGAYTVQVPAYFVEKMSTHRHAQQILLKLLSPKDGPDEFGYLTPRGALRHLELAAPDKNQEDKGTAGRKRSRRVLREKIAYQERGKESASQASPTLFHARIADIVEGSMENQRQMQIIDQMARSGAADPKSAAAAAGWVSIFPNFGDDPEFEQIRKEVNFLMSYSAFQNFRRREGEKEDEARMRFKKLPEEIRQKFGGRTASGEEKDEFYGECGDVLAKCSKAQVDIFRRVVRLYLVETLMGRDEDPIVAKSGKLGYACDLFDGLVQELGDFIEILDKVRHRREELKPELRLQGMSEKAKRYLEASSGKKLFWLWEHPDVKSSEDAYLQAQQRNVELRREDILHIFVRQTGVQMQNLCRQVHDSLQHWIWHLATGDDASGMPGLWDSIRSGQQEIENAQSYDRKFPLSELVADEILDATEKEVAAALRQWNWVVKVDGTGIKIEAEVLPASLNVEPLAVADPWLEDTQGKRVKQSEQNLAALIDLAQREFAGFASRTTVAEEIKKKYPNPGEFADKVVKGKAEPLFYGIVANSRKKSNLIRVQAQENDQYFAGENGLEGVLRERENLRKDQRDDSYSIQVVGSENPYKLTIVRTDDLYEYDHFGAWGECKRDYEQHFGNVGKLLDPSLMHIFPSEARAATYERQDYRGTNVYNEIHPRVVMFLEDPSALQQFFYLFALGKVDDTESNDTYRWELDLTGDGREAVWLTPGWRETDQVERQKPTLMNAVHGYVVFKNNHSPVNRKPIDCTMAQEVIDKAMHGLGGPAVEVEWIKHALSDEGMVGWIRSQAKDPDGGPERKEYLDLARVARMMFEERMKVLEEKTQGGKRFKPFTPPSEADSNVPKTDANT